MPLLRHEGDTLHRARGPCPRGSDGDRERGGGEYGNGVVPIDGGSAIGTQKSHAITRGEVMRRRGGNHRRRGNGNPCNGEGLEIGRDTVIPILHGNRCGERW